jgi:hypothetical protein
MEDKNTTFIERFLDRPIALLIFSSAIFAVSYFIWGLIVVMSTPPIPEALKELILGGK